MSIEDIETKLKALVTPEAEPVESEADRQRVQRQEVASHQVVHILSTLLRSWRGLNLDGTTN